MLLLLHQRAKNPQNGSYTNQSAIVARPLVAVEAMEAVEAVVKAAGALAAELQAEEESEKREEKPMPDS